MSYDKTNWVNEPSTVTPISAANLNHLETQYDSALATADARYERGTLTVLYVSPSGSNTNSGLTSDKAKATIGGALTALAGPGVVNVAAGTITETATWGAVPAGTLIRGAGKGATKVLHGFNGDMGTLGNDVKITDLTIDGQGATFTGRGFYITGGFGRQKLTDAALTSFDGYCLEFDFDAGSQFSAIGLDASRVSALTGTGRYAIKISDTQQLSAVPHTFVGLQTQGTCGIDFGGCNDVLVVASIVGDLRFTADSRGVSISSTRILNQVALTMNGHNNSIVGCDVMPQITIAAGADTCTIGPGSFNTLPIIDNSGNSRNSMNHWFITYTPTLTSGGTAPVLGNGTLTGSYSRQGSVITFTVELTVGSTTTLGSGALRFGLPQARSNSKVAVCGSATITIGATNYTAAVRIPGAVDYCDLIRDTSGSVTLSSPAAFTAGSIIRFTCTYPV